MATNEQTSERANEASDDRNATIMIARDAVMMGRADDAVRILSQVMSDDDAKRGAAAMVYEYARATTPKSQPPTNVGRASQSRSVSPYPATTAIAAASRITRMRTCGMATPTTRRQRGTDTDADSSARARVQPRASVGEVQIAIRHRRFMDSMILGDFDWREWFVDKPSSMFLAGASDESEYRDRYEY